MSKFSRFQVPVSKQLANRINELAKAMRRSLRWTVAELLVAVVKDRQSLADHLSARLLAWIHSTTEAMSELILAEQSESNGVVHLDIEVDAETSAHIQALADRLGHTPAKMAGMMLEWGVQENDFAIRLIAVPLLEVQRCLNAISKPSSRSTKRRSA